MFCCDKDDGTKSSIATAIIETPVSSAEIVNKNNQSAEIVEVIVIEVEIGGGKEPVQLIPFTSDDLVAGQLIKKHKLRRRVTTVTVTDNNGKHYSPSINDLGDDSRVSIDLKRYNVQGTWYLTIR